MQDKRQATLTKYHDRFTITLQNQKQQEKQEKQNNKNNKQNKRAHNKVNNVHFICSSQHTH
jgi:hypothetical protein